MYENTLEQGTGLFGVLVEDLPSAQPARRALHKHRRTNRTRCNFCSVFGLTLARALAYSNEGRRYRDLAELSV